MTQLDYYIINSIVQQIKTIKNAFYLTPVQEVTTYIFLILSIVIYSINICKRKKK